MAYFNLDSNTTPLPLPPPPRSTAAEVNTVIFPHSCQAGVGRAGKKKKKLWEDKRKEQSKVFQQDPFKFFRDIFWKGKSFSGIIVLTGEKEEVSQLFSFFFFGLFVSQN